MKNIRNKVDKERRIRWKPGEKKQRDKIVAKSLFRIRDSLVLLPHYTSSGLIIAKSYSELIYAVLCTDCFLSSKKRQLLNADLNWNLSTFVFIFHLNVNCKLVNVSVDNLRLDPWPALNIHVFSFSNEIGEFCPFPLNWSTSLIEMSKCYLGGLELVCLDPKNIKG